MKIKSLSEEASIIRKEEQLAPTRAIRLDLQDHRRGKVRYVTRHALLAYAFLRGIPYRRIEPKTHEPPDEWKVAEDAKTFSFHRDREGSRRG